MMCNNRPTIYVAPDTRTIQRFAELVCSQLATSRNMNMQKPEIVRGLVQFLVFLAQFEAKRRNVQDSENR